MENLSIESIPKDVLFLILNFLNLEEMRNFQCVNSFFYHRFSGYPRADFWKHLSELKPDLRIPLESDCSFYKYFLRKKISAEIGRLGTVEYLYFVKKKNILQLEGISSIICRNTDPNMLKTLLDLFPYDEENHEEDCSLMFHELLLSSPDFDTFKSLYKESVTRLRFDLRHQKVLYNLAIEKRYQELEWLNKEGYIPSGDKEYVKGRTGYVIGK
jgi:hypothetical protein